VKKVTKIGGGSAMMTELSKTADLVRRMVGAVGIPVTAKMRLGWDSENITAPDLARVLEIVACLIANDICNRRMARVWRENLERENQRLSI